MLRPLRAFAYPGAIKELVELPLYRQYGDTYFRADLYHHLSHKDYLRQGLTVRTRTQLVLQHYAFESSYWTDDYHQAVYGGSGLELWRAQSDEVFAIRLQAGNRAVPEGDLLLCLWMGDLPLHRMSFNWFLETPDGNPVPFIARTQSGSRSAEARAAFQHCFPQNSPGYFCYAAVQGISQLVGSSSIYGVRAKDQLCVDEGAGLANFEKSYDSFWQTLGGKDQGGPGFNIPLPAHQKSLNDLSRSHRKRAKARRAHWAAIEAAAAAKLKPLASHRQPSPDWGFTNESLRPPFNSRDRRGRRLPE